MKTKSTQTTKKKAKQTAATPDAAAKRQHVEWYVTESDDGQKEEMMKQDLPYPEIGTFMTRSGPAMPHVGAMISRALDIKPASFNEADHTVEIVYSTGAIAQRDGYLEELVVSDDAIDTYRLDMGAVSLIQDHMPWGDPVGRVIAHRVEGTNAIATVVLSRGERHASTVSQIIEGTSRTVSCGYFIRAYEIIEEAGVTTMRVTKWEPAEISLTVMPADPMAQIRSAFSGNPMLRSDGPPSAPEITPAPADPAPALAETSEEDIPMDPEILAAIEAERQRSAAVRALITQHNLPDSFRVAHDDGGSTLEVARAAALTAIAERSNEDAPALSTPRARITRDEQETFVTRATEAVTARLTGAAPTDATRDLINLTPVDIARRMVSGGASMSQYEVLGAAFQQRSGMHTTSDFAHILGDPIVHALRRSYEQAPESYASFVFKSTTSAPGEIEILNMGEAPGLKKVEEGEEYQAGTMGGGKEKILVEKYGRIFPVSIELLLKDGNNFAMIASRIAKWGRRAAEIRSNITYAALTDGRKMSDGYALFHAKHGNLITRKLTSDGFAAGIQAMMSQTDSDGSAITMIPKTLIVGPENYMNAKRVLFAPMATKSEDYNPWADGSIGLATDPRIKGSDWYLAADPAGTDTIELVGIAGEEGLSVTTADNFDADGMRIKARLWAGAGATDHRGLLKSTGTVD